MIELTEQILWTPIPNMDRERKLRADGYGNVPLDTEHPLFNDPVVSLAEYGISSLSYYSRPTVTGDAIPGVNPEIDVRRDVAERLVRVNDFLQAAEFVTAHAGGTVELYVKEGLRPLSLQAYLVEVRWPEFLRRQHPDWTDEQIIEERDRRVAYALPSSPHASGGAVDVKLRRVEDKFALPVGVDHKNDLTTRTDYFETKDGDRHAQVNRRILFHVMAAAGFINNPEEVWHFGTGDKLSSLLAGRPAYYGPVQSAPEIENDTRDR